MKKIIGFSICMLLIILALPTSTADIESFTKTKDDVEIDINAGFRGKDIGLGFGIYVLNHKTEDVNVFINVTFDYLIRNDMDGTYGLNFTVYSEVPSNFIIMPIICSPDGIKSFSITAEAGNTIVTRSGFSIRRLVILFK